MSLSFPFPTNRSRATGSSSIVHENALGHHDPGELSEQATHCRQCDNVLTEHEAESNDGWCDGCDSRYERQLYERERREVRHEEVVGYARITERSPDAEELTFFACTIPFRDAWRSVDFVTITRGAWEDSTSVVYHAPCQVCRRVHR